MGTVADLIVVDDNPLIAIENVRQLQLVFKEGVVVSDKHKQSIEDKEYRQELEISRPHVASAGLPAGASVTARPLRFNPLRWVCAFALDLRERARISSMNHLWPGLKGHLVKHHVDGLCVR